MGPIIYFKRPWQPIHDILFPPVSLIHSMSAHCGARPNSIAQSTVGAEITQLREEMGLKPYPEPVGLKVEDVEFR